jgi:hypothetical protein
MKFLVLRDIVLEKLNLDILLEPHVITDWSLIIENKKSYKESHSDDYARSIMGIGCEGFALAGSRSYSEQSETLEQTLTS